MIAFANSNTPSKQELSNVDLRAYATSDNQRIVEYSINGRVRYEGEGQSMSDAISDLVNQFDQP